jgi:hypothetical protein
MVVLTRVERGYALLAVAVVYLVIVLVPLHFGWTIGRHVTVVHRAIQGAVLLLAGAGFAVARRFRA